MELYMMEVIVALIVTGWLVLLQYSTVPKLTNDTMRYSAMAEGRRVMIPWCLRKCIPWLVGHDKRLWRSWTMIHLVLLSIALMDYLSYHGATQFQIFFGIFLLMGLPGIMRFNVEYPWLVDIPAIAWALVATNATLTGQPWWLIACASLMAGGMKETAPLLAALFAWSPIPLLGLLTPLVLWFISPKVTDDIVFGANYRPNKWFKQGNGELLNMAITILPWGIALPLALMHPTWQLGIALLFAYAQIVIASDRMRLYQQVFPVVILCAVQVPIVPWLIAPLLLLHLFNPFAKLPN